MHFARSSGFRVLPYASSIAPIKIMSARESQLFARKSSLGLIDPDGTSSVFVTISRISDSDIFFASLISKWEFPMSLRIADGEVFRTFEGRVHGDS